jgi:hypothetical protein
MTVIAAVFDPELQHGEGQFPAAPELARMLSELPVNVHIVPIGSVNIFGTSRIAELGSGNSFRLLS